MGFEPPKEKELEEKVFGVRNEKEFAQIALDVFLYQFFANPVYAAFCKALGRGPHNVAQVNQIPFLPIQFFKSQAVKAGDFLPQTVFTSSGTTGSTTSRHYIKDLSLYERSFFVAFELAFGPAENVCILGLLPSYLERGDSSLVYMVDRLIKKTGHPLSGFYLYDLEKLNDTLRVLENNGQRTILFGVTYALLDFAERFAMPLRHTTIVETGGMKGRKKEMTKPELYALLQSAFSIKIIHAEYGMTELLSQAYAVNGLYRTPPWMQILLRDETDPFFYSAKSGGINVIDLANLYSCSFIATDDRGRLHATGEFEVLGRLDFSDVRGCSQMVL